MFQPHSVRALLRRRNNSRFDTEEKTEPMAGGDPDMEGVVETKLMIKGTQPIT
jgi:hypothetical protein